MLLDFPAEVLMKVLECFDGRKSHLLNIALTNKVLNVLSTPLIYETVIFKNDDDLQYLPAFTALVSRSSEHARMVRSFALRVADGDSPWTAQSKAENIQWSSQLNNSDAIASRIEEVLPTSSLRQQWKHLLIRDGGPDPTIMNFYVSMILPNVETVLYCNLLFSRRCQKVFEELVEVMHSTNFDLSEPLFWANVKEVSFEGLQDKSPNQTKSVAMIARIPWLKHLTCSAVGDSDGGETNPGECDENGGFDILEPISTELESIILQPSSKLKASHMDRLLMAPKALKIFKYNAGHTWAWTAFETPKLEASLRHQIESLEEISLTHYFYEFLEGFGSNNDKMNPMTFSDFASLKILEISLPFVFGHGALQFGEGDATARIKGSSDPTENAIKSMKRRLIEMLPARIEELRFAQLGQLWATRFLNSALVELLGWHGERFQKLKRIELHFYPDTADKCLPELQLSITKALKLGIEIKAFQAGRLGRDDVREGWSICFSQDVPIGEVQIPI